MAGSVRIAGPEFLDARSRAAFARIEESIRQFTSHSRESIALVRNPLKMDADHFVTMWSKGAAVCVLVHQGGRVRGGMKEDWSQEASDRSSSSDFENPLPELERARHELLARFETVLPARQTSVEAVGDDDPEPDPVLSVIAEQNGGASRSAMFEHCTRGIVLLTVPVDKLRIDHLAESKEFAVLALDQAVMRTIFHMPNLLRVIDFETSFFAPEEVTSVADSLEAEATARIQDRAIVPAPPLRRPRRRASTKGGSAKWIVLAVAVLATLGLFFFFSGDQPVSPANGGKDTSGVTPSHLPTPESRILLRLPQETQAFVAPVQFESRAQLLQAIGAGQGKRLFPAKEQVITYDSLTFAKGVYGYFKVDGEWRSGKLLQTLRSTDTIIIENFLPPLP